MSAWTNPNIKKQILLYNGFPGETQLDLYKLPGNIKITKFTGIGESGSGSAPFVYYRATIDSSWSGFGIGNGEHIAYFDFSSNVVENVEKMIIVFTGYDNLTISYTIIPEYENIIKPRIKYINVYTSIGPQRDHTSDNNPCENIKQIIELN